MGGHEGAEKNSDKSTETIARCSCCRNKGSFQQCCLPIKDSASMDSTTSSVPGDLLDNAPRAHAIVIFLSILEHLASCLLCSALLCLHPARTRCLDVLP